MQLSTCASAGGAPLQASGLHMAAAQSLSATSTAYSSMVVVTRAVQGSTACASSSLNTAGRHLLAAEPSLDAAPEEASGYWLAMQTTGLGEDVSGPLHNLSIMGRSTDGPARQLMQLGSPAVASTSETLSPEHYQASPRAFQGPWRSFCGPTSPGEHF